MTYISPVQRSTVRSFIVHVELIIIVSQATHLSHIQNKGLVITHTAICTSAKNRTDQSNMTLAEDCQCNIP